MSAKVMVTGSLGFIGSRLTESLLRDGYEVLGVDCMTDAYDQREKARRLETLSEHSRYSHASVDLALSPLDYLLERVEVIYHLAGRAGVRDSFSVPSKYHHDNVESMENILRAARRSSTVRRLVYASSSSVYGDAPLPFDEEGPTNPLSPYGQSKLDAERLCLDASNDQFSTIALRYFTVYGPGQRPDMGLRIFAEAALDDRPLTVFGDGTQSRDFTYVDDIVKATRLAGTVRAEGVAVNVGGGSRINLLNVFDILADLVGHPVKMDFQDFARGDARHTGARLERASDFLGFSPDVRFEDGYAAEVRWLRSLRVDTKDSK